jgi:hypothetical protein
MDFMAGRRVPLQSRSTLDVNGERRAHVDHGLQSRFVFPDMIIEEIVFAYNSNLSLNIKLWFIIITFFKKVIINYSDLLNIYIHSSS